MGRKKVINRNRKNCTTSRWCSNNESGDTIILATAVAAKKSNPETDFFPLTVNYQEKYYSAGKIPGGYFKREARPTEAETLISRLIDRPIRPLFQIFRNETQVLQQ